MKYVNQLVVKSQGMLELVSKSREIGKTALYILLGIFLVSLLHILIVGAKQTTVDKTTKKEAKKKEINPAAKKTKRD